jgi:hypothetical protein
LIRSGYGGKHKQEEREIADEDQRFASKAAGAYCVFEDE